MSTDANPTFEFGRHKLPLHERDSSPAERWLLSVVDLGLAGIIFVAPYFFGGRHDLGRFVFVLLVAITAAAWFVRQALRTNAGWRPTFAHTLLLLSIGLVALQIVPLPDSWIEQLAPRNGELLPLWNGHGEASVRLGGWQTLSLTPHDTTKALALLLGYALLLVVVVQRVRDAKDVQRLLRWIGASAVMMAVFGLLQYFASNGLFFWFYEHPFRDPGMSVCGSFINRNHFADFLVLGFGPLAAWLVASVRQHAKAAATRRTARSSAGNLETLAVGSATSIVLFAILLSMSRGGTLALLVSILVLGAVYAHARLVDSKYLCGAIGLAVVIIGLLSLYGYDQVARRLDSLTEGSVDAVDTSEARRKIWTANVDAFQAGWITGAGIGSHSMIYPVYLPESSSAEYTHAESGYLQIATEAGIGGVALLALGLGLCGSWCVTCLRNSQVESELILFGACAAGLAASAAHSVVDFVWYIPACMSLTIVLAGCTLRLAQLARESAGAPQEVARIGRLTWVLGSALVVALGAWMVTTMLGPSVASIHWDRYLRTSRANGMAMDQTLRDLVANRDVRSPAAEEFQSQAMLHELEQVVAWEPSFARAHLRLAAHLVNEFERRQRRGANPMDVTQVRDAAVASQFASSGELHAWLRRAFGADADLLYRAQAHARAGVALCPLQGEGYLSLANLCFLDGGGPAKVAAYIDQGLRVRPYGGDILFEAGRQKLLAGDVNGALAHWTRCYRDAGPHRLRIIHLLAGRIPAEMFLATFQPDWQTLMPIWNRYRQTGQLQDLQSLVVYAYQAAQRESAELKDVRAARIWQWQAAMFTDLGQADRALECLQRAYAANPRVYEVRYALGKALLGAGQFTQAEPHLRWCLSRHPENKHLSEALVQLAKGRAAEEEQRRDPNVRQASVLGL